VELDHYIKRAAVAAAFLLSFSLSGAKGQVVLVPDGHGPEGSPEYCSWVEKIRPNLKLREDTSVRGHVADQTAVPFRNSPIELRRFISEAKQTIVRKASTDADGNFDLGTVQRGDYRLLLSPHRGFKQPDKLACRAKDCVLDVSLIANPTDQLAVSCPIR
jgi:hypothetical protein